MLMLIPCAIVIIKLNNSKKKLHILHITYGYILLKIPGQNI
jgi:hypothetical protein